MQPDLVHFTSTASRDSRIRDNRAAPFWLGSRSWPCTHVRFSSNVVATFPAQSSGYHLTQWRLMLSIEPGAHGAGYWSSRYGESYSLLKSLLSQTQIEPVRAKWRHNCRPSHRKVLTDLPDLAISTASNLSICEYVRCFSRYRNLLTSFNWMSCVCPHSAANGEPRSYAVPDRFWLPDSR